MNNCSGIQRVSWVVGDGTSTTKIFVAANKGERFNNKNRTEQKDSDEADPGRRVRQLAK